MPYPYGYARDATICSIDKSWRPYHESAMRPRDGIMAMAEMDRLWQGVRSGSQPRCRSPFGVYDLTGNVDEWTRVRTRRRAAKYLEGRLLGDRCGTLSTRDALPRREPYLLPARLSLLR